MRRLPIALTILGLTGCETVILVSNGGFMNAAAFISVIPFLAGTLGAILSSLSPTDNHEHGSLDERDDLHASPAPVAPAAKETLTVPVQAQSKRYPTIQARLYKKAMPALFSSIVDYLNKTSDPMSETLVKIRTVIADFRSAVQKKRSSFEDKKDTTSLKEGIDQLRNHITSITDETSRSFTEVSEEIERLNGRMMSILDIVANISDIAERVHVLSINASIEAARAGSHGKGFKVIADEIQRLSKETQTFVTTIGVTVGTTKSAFGSLHITMQKNQKIIERMVTEDSSTYDTITLTIERQLADFMELYAGTVTFIESIEIDMTTLSPIAMLHAIITQEIENLGKVSDDLLNLIEKHAGNPDDFAAALGDCTTADRLRSRLTTSRELDALGETLRGLGMDEQCDLKRTNTDIELF
jgi:hypothetical protein